MSKINKLSATLSFDPGDLEALLNSCRRNRRLPTFPKHESKIFFDADRFREICADEQAARVLLAGVLQNRTRNQIRGMIDTYLSAKGLAKTARGRMTMADLKAIRDVTQKANK